MSSHDAEPPSQPERAYDGPEPGSVRIWMVTLSAVLLAGAGSWWAAEQVIGRHAFKPVMAPGLGSPEESHARLESLKRGITGDASMAFALLGAALGFALGVAGGIARRSVPSALVAGVVGLVAAGGAGFLATHLMLPIYFSSFGSGDNDLGLAVVALGGVCAPMGAMAGAALGLGLRDGGRRLSFRLVAGGLLGAIAGVVLYQLVGALAFPFDGTSLPLSTSRATRLLHHESVAALTALGVLTSRSIGPRGA